MAVTYGFYNALNDDMLMSELVEHGSIILGH